MTYEELITKIGKVVDDHKLLLRVQGETICIDGEYFSLYALNKIQRILQLYRECEWWIYPSDTLKNGVMYKVNILRWR